MPPGKIRDFFDAADLARFPKKRGFRPPSPKRSVQSPALPPFSRISGAMTDPSLASDLARRALLIKWAWSLRSSQGGSLRLISFPSTTRARTRTESRRMIWNTKLGFTSPKTREADRVPVVHEQLVQETRSSNRADDYVLVPAVWRSRLVAARSPPDVADALPQGKRQICR